MLTRQKQNMIRFLALLDNLAAFQAFLAHFTLWFFIFLLHNTERLEVFAFTVAVYLHIVMMNV